MQIKRSNFILTQRDYWLEATLLMRNARKANNLKEQIIEKNRKRVGEIVH